MILYGTSACHLCEVAEQLLAEMLADKRLTGAIELIDIADSDTLVDQFGVRIPVLVDGDKALDWPFTVDDVLALQAAA
jgi:hypothetical protein